MACDQSAINKQTEMDSKDSDEGTIRTVNGAQYKLTQRVDRNRAATSGGGSGSAGSGDSDDPASLVKSFVATRIDNNTTVLFKVLIGCGEDSTTRGLTADCDCVSCVFHCSVLHRMQKLQRQIIR